MLMHARRSRQPHETAFVQRLSRDLPLLCPAALAALLAVPRVHLAKPEPVPRARSALTGWFHLAVWVVEVAAVVVPALQPRPDLVVGVRLVMQPAPLSAQPLVAQAPKHLRSSPLVPQTIDARNLAHSPVPPHAAPAPAH